MVSVEKSEDLVQEAATEIKKTKKLTGFLIVFKFLLPQRPPARGQAATENKQFNKKQGLFNC